jgi:glycosyltransferase involved in cell wall biosynthesis
MNPSLSIPVARVISICVCTFKRPSGIRRALKSLRDMAHPDGWSIEFIIVDNDASGSAMAALQQDFPDGLPDQVRYFIEPTPGVSHARNRCLQEARGELIGFIDDDEWVRPEWLVCHIEALDRYSADAVFGPVTPQLEESMPSWAAACGAYRRKQFDSGTELSWPNAQSGNTVFRRRLIESLGLRFSTHFARTGGEDSFFFAQAKKAGCKLVWCEKAELFETVPATRLTRKWSLERAFHGGRTYVRLRSALGMPWAYPYYAVYGMLYALLLLPVWGLLTLTGSQRQMRYALKIVGNLGKVAARFFDSGKYSQS